MPNILCITFPVEPSEIDLAESLVGRAIGTKNMYVSYWFDEDDYDWQIEAEVGNWDDKEIVISSIHQLDQAKLLVNLGLDSTTIKGILNA